MAKDPTAFRERFKAYKDGKSVKEIYDGGLPRYAEGTQDDYTDTMNFLKQYEGFKDTVYLDGKGVPTIGYGFTDPALVKQKKIGQKAAYARLRQEIINRDAFLKTIKNWDKLGEGAKTALRSYYYNYPAGFRDTTKFMRAWNAGDYAEAIRQVDAGMNDPRNPGLRKRRLSEQELLKADPFLMQEKRIAQPRIKPIVEQPVSTAVRLTIPAVETITTYDPTISPYITGKPMIRLQPRTQLPDLMETMRALECKPSFKDGKDEGESVELWADRWQERLLPSARSKVIQKWNATGQKPQSESSEEYTKRRVKETTWKKPSGRKMLEMAPTVVDFVPGSGDAKQALEATAAGLKGNYTEAGLLGAGFVLPAATSRLLKPVINKINNFLIDRAYNKAISNGNVDEARHLVEKQFLRNAPNTTIVDDGKPVVIYHGTPNRWNVWDPDKFGSSTDEGYFGVGMYGSYDKRHAAIYANGEDGNIKKFYINAKNPFDHGMVPGIPSDQLNQRAGVVYYFNRYPRPIKSSYDKLLWDELDRSDATNYWYTDGNKIRQFDELVVPNANQMKSANIITYDNNGKMIPLSKRFDYSSDDIRFANGKSPIRIKPSKRGSFTAAAKRRGMSVSQLERAVLNNPSKYSKAMRKKAQFSRNARSWKK